MFRPAGGTETTMAKFKFRLATLLRIREAARDERRSALAEAYRVDGLLRQQLDGVARDLEALAARRRQAAGPGEVKVDRLVEAQRYEVTLRRQQRQTVRQREAVAAEIERRRQALIEADREVRVLEKLREKQADQHRTAEERRDASRLDEVAQQQAMREAAL
jgi:flagellar protein FliJ